MENYKNSTKIRKAWRPNYAQQQDLYHLSFANLIAVAHFYHHYQSIRINHQHCIVSLNEASLAARPDPYAKLYAHPNFTFHKSLTYSSSAPPLPPPLPPPRARGGSIWHKSTLHPMSPHPMSPLPMSPLPMTPLPMSPLPMTPLPMSPLPMSPLPKFRLKMSSARLKTKVPRAKEKETIEIP